LVARDLMMICRPARFLLAGIDEERGT